MTNETYKIAPIGHNQWETGMSVRLAESELAALRQEIEALNARIGEKRARAIKLEHYIEMAREFGGPGVDVSGSSQSARSNEPRQRAPQGGMSGRAARECMTILRERGHPVPTNELYRLISERGVQLGGKNPAQTLSGYLSRTPGLVADRSRGWSLAEWDVELPINPTESIESPQSAMAA